MPIPRPGQTPNTEAEVTSATFTISFPDGKLFSEGVFEPRFPGVSSGLTQH